MPSNARRTIGNSLRDQRRRRGIGRAIAEQDSPAAAASPMRNQCDVGEAEAAERVAARPDDEHPDQRDVGDGAGDRAEADARDGHRAIDALLLEEPDVERHAADAGRRQLAGERRGDLADEHRSGRDRCGTAPAKLSAAPTYVTADIAHDRAAPRPSRRRWTWLTMPGRSANCGSRKYVAPATISDHQDHPPVDAFELGEVDLGDAGLTLDLRCSSASRPGCCLMAALVAPLNAWSCRRGSASADGARPSTSRARRTGRSGPATTASDARSWATSASRSGSSTASSAKPKSISHGSPAGVDEDVRPAQVPVGDSVAAQQGDLAEQRAA